MGSREAYNLAIAYLHIRKFDHAAAMIQRVQSASAHITRPRCELAMMEFAAAQLACYQRHHDQARSASHHALDMLEGESMDWLRRDILRFRQRKYGYSTA